MSLWLRTLWNIALLRAGPQDLPPGPASPVLAVLVYCGIVMISGLADTRESGFVDLFVAVILPLALAGVVLAVRRRAARFNQTVAALFGTGAIISLVNVPLWLSTADPVPAPLALLALIGLFWSLAVDGHIWRHALDTSFAGGLMTAVVILLVQLFTFQALGTP